MSAFVTGASRGIGLALVQGLLRQGRRVVAAQRGQSQALQALHQEYPERLLPVKLDLTDEASIKSAAAEAETFAGDVQLLVHNAGIMHPSGRGENSVSRLEFNAFSQVLATNVLGPAMLTKALYPRLRAAAATEPSKVVAVGAGVASLQGNQAGGWYSYRASKTAMNAFMKNLSIEGARHKVMAFTLYPQMVDTALAKPYVKGNPYPELRTPEETAERMLELLQSFGPADTGRFVNIWSKEDIPW
ncbi:unnamed protein product [Effrenium voratum]|uniref:Uncharacterized protein n=1 Tax=Effrenium voratum TaxID=2562239 RepID=A0AA36I5H3_9DINO|nr:unnamed protein product [Effrenium voratum]CAJ1442744.1 unnamed protein product [Effrenium voratum]